jgi:competence protein ComEA
MDVLTCGSYRHPGKYSIMELMEMFDFHILSIFRRLTMNPFTESTVARPLNPGTSRQAGRASSRHAQKKRAFWRPAWGALSLSAGLTLSATALAVDVNVATQAQLQEVRGIGPKTAQIILEERARGGKYESFDDLAVRVKGIGPKKAATLQASGLTVGGGTLASTSPAVSSGTPALATPRSASAKPKSSAPGKQAR